MNFHGTFFQGKTLWENSSHLFVFTRKVIEKKKSENEKYYVDKEKKNWRWVSEDQINQKIKLMVETLRLVLYSITSLYMKSL